MRAREEAIRCGMKAKELMEGANEILEKSERSLFEILGGSV